jgi:hypothetical protein
LSTPEDLRRDVHPSQLQVFSANVFNMGYLFYSIWFAVLVCATGKNILISSRIKH